jgi:hypothetical protein
MSSLRATITDCSGISTLSGVFSNATAASGIECEAVSLTRGIPIGLGWLVTPIVRELPRESLTHTLEATRLALR